MTHSMTWEQCLDRWPRLVRACQWYGTLGQVEAACTLRDYRVGRQLGVADYGGGEAAWSCGGPLKLIQDAICHRNQARHYRRHQLSLSLD